MFNDMKAFFRYWEMKTGLIHYKNQRSFKSKDIRFFQHEAILLRKTGNVKKKIKNIVNHMDFIREEGGTSWESRIKKMFDNGTAAGIFLPISFHDHIFPGFHDFRFAVLSVTAGVTVSPPGRENRFKIQRLESNMKKEANKCHQPQQESIADRLKRIREILGLKQYQLAEKINVPGSSLSDLENQKTKKDFKILKSLAAELNVNLYYLLFGEGDMFIEAEYFRMITADAMTIDRDQVRTFFRHFIQSPSLQLLTIAYYRKVMLMEKNILQKEFDEYCKKSESPKIPGTIEPLKEDPS
jgi:transcriptional regulator with XRE-family HTH domain